MAVITRPGIALIPDPRSTLTPGPMRLTSVFPIKTGDPHLLYSGAQFEVNDVAAFTQVEFNDFDDCIRTAEKVFDEGLDYVDTFTPKPLFAALKCRPGALGGGTIEEFEARARERLAYVETSYLEASIAQYVSSNFPDADISDTSVLGQVAQLLVRNDVPGKTLHLSSAAAVLLGSGLDNILAQGIKVVAGPAYGPLGIITGEVTIWGGEVQVSHALDLENNYTMVIAERQYIISLGTSAPIWDNIYASS